MKRSSKKTIPVHVTIPVRTLEDLDETLSYKQSRSKLITQLIQNHLKSNTESLQQFSTLELLEHIQFRFDKDSSEDVVIASLLQILSE